MLATDDVLVLGEQLAPPAGFEADALVAGTYSLDLSMALGLPLALIQQGRFAGQTAETADRYATLEAVRRLSSRFRVFHDASGLLPGRHHRLLSVLHRVAVPVAVPSDGGPRSTFHPKFVLVRFRRDGAGPQLRLVFMSRNLTGDAALDISVVLEAEVSRRAGGDASSTRLAAALEQLVLWSVHPDDDGSTAALVHDLVRSVRRATWQPPSGFGSVDVWPLGFGGSDDPVRSRPDERRTLVVSPFLRRGRLQQVAAGAGPHVLLSAEAELAAIDTAALERFDQVKVLDPERAPGTGIHAKLYVHEGPRHRRWVIGSANATTAAATRNAELVVELTTSPRGPGIDGLLSDDGGIGRVLLDAGEFERGDLPPSAPSPSEDALRALAAHRFTVRVRRLVGGTAELEVQLEPPLPQGPATVRVGLPGRGKAIAHPGAVPAAVLPPAPRRALTRWLAVEAESAGPEGTESHERLFAVELVGADLDELADAAVTDLFRGDDGLDPLDYVQRALAGSIPDAVGLRFDEEEDSEDEGDEDGADAGHEGASASASHAVLEPLLGLLEQAEGGIGDDLVLQDATAAIEARRAELPSDFLELWDAVVEVHGSRA